MFIFTVNKCLLGIGGEGGGRGNMWSEMGLKLLYKHFRACSPIRYPGKYILEDSPLPNKSLFGWLNNIFILLQTNGSGKCVDSHWPNINPIFKIRYNADKYAGSEIFSNLSFLRLIKCSFGLETYLSEIQKYKQWEAINRLQFTQMRCKVIIGRWCWTRVDMFLGEEWDRCLNLYLWPSLFSLYK